MPPICDGWFLTLSKSESRVDSEYVLRADSLIGESYPESKEILFGGGIGAGLTAAAIGYQRIRKGEK